MAESTLNSEAARVAESRAVAIRVWSHARPGLRR